MVRVRVMLYSICIEGYLPLYLCCHFPPLRVRDVGALVDFFSLFPPHMRHGRGENSNTKNRKIPENTQNTAVTQEQRKGVLTYP